jgi:type 1 glutamine amidotransferase
MSRLRVLAIGGNEVPWHRFEEVAPMLEAFLEADGMDVETTTARTVLLPERIEAYDAVLDYRTQHGTRDDERSGLLDFVRDGGGYVALHGAGDLDDRVKPAFRDLLGGEFVTHPAQSDLHVEVVADHPVVEGVGDFDVHDEPYQLEWDDGIEILAETEHESFGRMPVLWVKPYGSGRVVYCSLGHRPDVFRNGSVREIVRNAVRWAAND